MAAVRAVFTHTCPRALTTISATNTGAVLTGAYPLRRTLRPHVPPTEALIAARCMELLNTFDTSLLADLRQLSGASVEAFPEQPRSSRLLRAYTEVMHAAMSAWS